jgi:hypothetical protein
MAERVLVAHYRLDDPRHLFKEPDDPFSPDYGTGPALDDLVNHLYTTTSFRHVHLTLELPPEETTPSAVERIRLAILRYCEQSERDLDRTRRGERSRATFAVALALVVLVCFVIVNRSIRGNTDFWVEVVIEGIAVAFWVAVWFPLDTLLFGQWQHRLDQRIYRTIAEMDLHVVAWDVDVAPGDAAGAPTDPAAGSSSGAS